MLVLMLLLATGAGVLAVLGVTGLLRQRSASDPRNSIPGR
jgi:hypothetical protein